MRFNQIIGQSVVKQQLVSWQRSGRLPHALMLKESTSRGALGLALALSTYLFCDHPTDTDSCGECGHCKKADKNIHPDISFSFPVVKAGNKDRKSSISNDFLSQWRSIVSSGIYFDYNQWAHHIGATTRGDMNVAECNEVIRKFGLTSFSGKGKILIMWLPEFLGAVGNKLLKLIEEPSDGSYFILVTQDADRILNTIQSRSQIVNIPPVMDAEIEKYLIEKHDISADRAEEITDLCMGDVRKAESMIHDEGDSLTDRVLEWLRLCYRQDPVIISQWVTEFASKTKDDQKGFYQYTLVVLREFLILGEVKISTLNTSETNKLVGLGKVLDMQKVVHIQELLNEAIVNIDRNANIKIMMTADCLRVGDIMRSAIAMAV